MLQYKNKVLKYNEDKKSFNNHVISTVARAYHRS